MAEVDARVGDRDDDVRVAGRELPRFGSVDVLVVRSACLSGVVQAPELAERRVVRYHGDRDHMVQLCVGDPRIARKDFGGKRLVVLLHLHEDGVDLAEALLRGRARVLEDRILLARETPSTKPTISSPLTAFGVCCGAAEIDPVPMPKTTAAPKTRSATRRVICRNASSETRGPLSTPQPDRCYR